MLNEESFQTRLAELVAEISALPEEQRSKLEVLAEQTKKRHEQLKQTVGDIQVSIDFLRLCIKYLMFYLEATRRENAYLRRMLEQRREEEF
jgi:hypothetical protein